MYKKEALSVITFIIKSISIIKRRFANIKFPDDFYANDKNLDLFDAICMRLQTIGEALKNINKMDSSLLL